MKKQQQIYRCNFTSSERSEREKFWVVILPKNYLNLHTFIHMHYQNQSNGSPFIRNQIKSEQINKYNNLFQASEASDEIFCLKPIAQTLFRSKKLRGIKQNKKTNIIVYSEGAKQGRIFFWLKTILTES